MYKVGITGGIGSGKSLVCSILETFGVPVYYADEKARHLMNHESDLTRGIKDLLGSEVYQNGKLARQLVAQRVFEDPYLLEALNQLVHPVVRSDFQRWCKNFDSEPYVVEEAAILFESGSHRFLDLTVFIYTPLELRIQRVMKRDGLSREDVEKRINRQMDEEKKKELADILVINDEKDMLLPRVVSLHENIIRRL